MQEVFTRKDIRTVHDLERPIFRMTLKVDTLEVEYIDYRTYIKRNIYYVPTQNR